MKRAIVFLAWGESYIGEVLTCIRESALPAYDKILITDATSEVPEGPLVVIRADFSMQGYLRKTELVEYLPDGYDSFVYLDSDTLIIDDIELGFVKAEQHGIAASPAPFYSLDYFWGFHEVLQAEGLSGSGQLQYNTGVLFFSISEKVLEVFRLWRDLGTKYEGVFRNNDQPFFTLAMEQLGFNPYTLSMSYNYRGFGDPISGVVRIWHAHTAMPADINQFDVVWPRRRVVQGRVVFPSRTFRLRRRWKKTVRRLKRLIR